MKVIINEVKPQGGKITLYTIEREDGKMLIDNTGPLDQVYYGHSEEGAKSFYFDQQQNDNIVWY